MSKLSLVKTTNSPGLAGTDVALAVGFAVGSAAGFAAGLAVAAGFAAGLAVAAGLGAAVGEVDGVSPSPPQAVKANSANRVIIAEIVVDLIMRDCLPKYFETDSTGQKNNRQW
jgi:fructoselysine-6-P-deglycase FrlB-like protein